MTFLGNYTNPDLESFSCVIKLREVESVNPKAPELRGFLVVTEEKLRDMLKYVSEKSTKVVYVDVALWAARDVQYKYEGKTSLREKFDPSESDIESARGTLTPPPPINEMFKI